ncbi:MAG: SpoIID/LytB domain-containing protein [Marmoricola sp.]
MGRRPLLRARRAIAALLAVVAATAGTLGVAAIAPANANVAVHEVYTIPTSGTSAGDVTILWRGNGHGHGLSQYGAQAAAQKGLTFAQILAFYYPGTTRSTAAGSIRVRLSAAPRDSLQVAPTSSLTVVDTGNGNVASKLPTTIGGVAVSQWRLGVNAQGKTLVSYLQSTWKAYKTLVGDGKFVDSSLGYVTLLNPSTKKYRGALLAASSVPGDLHRYTVNVVGIEPYVEGVVPSEMSPSWPAAALQSQAVAARTYALFERTAHSGNYYDICDTTMCQVYGGMAATNPLSTQAVAATKGVYLAYGGKAAFTQFSASNGGWESAGGFPYLPSKADPYTPTAEQIYGRSYSWSKPNTPVAPLQRAFPSVGTVRSVTITSREGGTGAVWQGRVMSLVVAGTQGSVTISGNTFATIFGLSSTWFTLQVAAPPLAKPTTYAVGAHVKPGWTASLGQPIGPEVQATVGGVTGYYQRFPKGYALANSKFGTFRLNGSILQRWSPAGQGWPTSAMTSQTAFGVQGWTQHFQSGRAIIASSYGAFTSAGSILLAWRPAVRGWPTTNLTSATVRGRAGWLQTFRKGSSGSDFAFAPKPSGAVVWSNGSPA